MTRAALLLVLVAACGDDLGSDIEAPDYEGSFEGEATAYFGAVASAAPPAPPEPLIGAVVCVEGVEECTASATGGEFIVSGPNEVAEAVIVVTAPDHMPTRVAARPSVTGDRNLGGLIMVAAEVVEQTAEVAGVEMSLEETGAVIVFASLFATGPVAVEIDDATTVYIDGLVQPDPELEQFSPNGIGVIVGVPPGEVVLRSTMGRCDAAMDGWPGEEPGTIRLPVAAGEVTIVHPLCGDGEP